MSVTVEQFGRGIVSAGIMTSDELKQWWSAQPADSKPQNAEHFSDLLREQNKLTSYQSKVLLQGKPAALVFDQYVFIEQLGKGGMGAVFKAKHRNNGRLAAIKVLSPQATKDETAIKRFQREVEAAGRLQHPRIVHAFDAGEFNGQHYLAMEYVDGSDLSTIVKTQGRLPIEQAVRCVQQTAEGLQYAHEQGVVHRDIKPANLLLEKNGNVRILDLGLVRFEDTADGLTGTQQIMGTIDYMAPEQIANTKLADARCDIYSLGVTMWILLTGKKVFEAKNMVDMVMKHRSGEIPSLAKERPEAPAGLDVVLQKMLAKKAEDRYQKVADLQLDLTAAMNGTLAAPAKPAEPAKSTEPSKHAEASKSAEPATKKSGSAPAKTDTAAVKSPTASTVAAESPLSAAVTSRKSSSSAGRRRAKSAGRKLVVLFALGGIVVASIMGVLLWYLVG